MASPMSEDQLFKALLKKKPEAQVPVRKEPKKEPPRPVPAAQPVEVYEEKEPVVEAPPAKPMETERMVEEIRNLTSSVNMMYGLIKTVMLPVLVLILIVGIAILLKR